MMWEKAELSTSNFDRVEIAYFVFSVHLNFNVVDLNCYVVVKEGRNWNSKGKV